MTKAVARLYQLVDEEIPRLGGVRPIEQGEGDSVVATFARASDALVCSVAIQRAIEEEEWPEDIQMKFRIGLHTGEAQLRDEGNYFWSGTDPVPWSAGGLHGVFRREGARRYDVCWLTADIHEVSVSCASDSINCVPLELGLPKGRAEFNAIRVKCLGNWSSYMRHGFETIEGDDRKNDKCDEHAARGEPKAGIIE